MDLRTGLKQVRTTILEPAQQQSGSSPAQQQATAAMLAFHRDSRAAFVELEVRVTPGHSDFSSHCSNEQV